MSIAIPPREDDAQGGAQFLSSLRGLSQQQAEERIFQEISRGNVPDFVRPENYREITVSTVIGQETVEARIRVAPDYFAIGSNSDFARVPITPILAQRIAQRFGLSLPTQRIADLIDVEARRTGGVLPFIGAGDIASRVTDPETGRKVSARWNYKVYGAYEARWMESVDFALMQNTMINERTAEPARSAVRSGHKKDVIYHPDVIGTGKVAIWRRGVQPLSTIHHERYQDYSHGIRFVSGVVELTYRREGAAERAERRSMPDVLNDPALYRLFSDARMDVTKMYRDTGRIVARKNEPPPPPPRQRQAQ